MKFNENTCALHLLRHDGPYYIDENLLRNGDTRTKFSEKMRKYQHLFGKEINFLSSAFLDALEDSIESRQRYEIDCPFKATGTLIKKLTKYIITIFYSIELNSSNHDIGIVNCCIFYFATDPERKATILLHFSDLVNYEIGIVSPPKAGIIEYMIRELITFIIFKKSCSVQTKIISPGKTTRHNKQEYSNKGKYPVTVLDSTWYTTTISTRGCMVSEKNGGYYRQQRCGPGRTEIKQVFVKAHFRKPYVRKAKVLKQRAAQQAPLLSN